MRRTRALCALGALSLLLSACNQMPDTHDADVKAIRDLEAKWNEDYVGKDPAKITAYYADDAVLIAPETPAMPGKAAILAAMKHMLSDPAISLKFQPEKVEVAKSGDVAWTQGSYTLTLTNPQTKQVFTDRGSYVTTYRKQADGSWKAVADIASSAGPPPGTAMPGDQGMSH